MGKYHFIVFLLVCANAIASGPLALRMEGKFVEDGEGPRTVHEWNHTVYAEPGQPTIADETRRKRCVGKDCVTEQFTTEVTAERVLPDLIQAKFAFNRKVGEETTRIDGTIFARPGETGELSVHTDQDTKQRYRLKLTPILDPKP